MIPVRRFIIKTNKDFKKVLTTINWHTHQVDNIWLAKSKKIDNSSTRPFIGKTTSDKNEFSLTRQRSYFESILPQVVVKGKFIEKGNTGFLNLRFYAGVYTILVVILIPLMLGVSFFDTSLNINSHEIKELLFFGGLVLFFMAFFIWLEIKKVKHMILKLLEV